jgi:predicted nucleic acid-binding protein
MSPKAGHAPLPVLIDTPTWRGYLRKEPQIFQEINALMDAGRVCSSHLMVAELLQAAETEEEIKIIQDFTRIFPLLKEAPGAWIEAARLSFKLRRKGKPLSLRDCYVVLLARRNGVLLYTTNKAFLQAQKASAIGLKLFPNRKAEP